MIPADDPWNFYFDQLAGLEPETTPGKPHAGYYLLRRRTVRPNDDPNRKPGDSRSKVTVDHVPVRIAYLETVGKWAVEVDQVMYLDTDYADQIFSRCCRNAIERDEYERLTNDTDSNEG